MTGVTNKPVRYVGDPDFHDGYIRSVSQSEDKLLVTIEGSSRKHYTVRFDGVSSVESHSPQDMMLYALSETDADVQSLRRYDFVNWHCDEPEGERSRSYLRVVANRFAVTESD